MAQNTYPLSAQNNRDIPLEVLESRGAVKQAFNASTALATMLSGFDKDEVLLHIRATEIVYIDFSDDGTTADSAKRFVAQKDQDYVLAIPYDYIDLTGDGTAGNAYINYITKYNTYALSVQLGGES